MFNWDCFSIIIKYLDLESKVKLILLGGEVGNETIKYLKCHIQFFTNPTVREMELVGFLDTCGINCRVDIKYFSALEEDRADIIDFINNFEAIVPYSKILNKEYAIKEVSKSIGLEHFIKLKKYVNSHKLPNCYITITILSSTIRNVYTGRDLSLWCEHVWDKQISSRSYFH